MKDSNKNKEIAVVIGMHRSGTSLCCQVLNMLGVNIASEQGVNLGNERGHYERWEIVEIHDEILRYYNRLYFSPFHDLPLPAGWWSDPKVQELKDKLKYFVIPHIREEKYFGFKDPRTTKLMPIWNIIFSELNVTPKYIVCVRNPAHVARSLHTRDGLSLDTGELRTLEYMVDAFRYTSGRDRAIIFYEDWFCDSEKNISKLQSLLDRRLTIDPVDAKIALRAIVAPEMNRSALPNARIHQQIVEYFYQIVQRHEKEPDLAPEALSELDAFVKHYTYFKYHTSPIGSHVEALTAGKAAAEDAVSAQATRLAEAQAQIHDLSEHARHLEAECEQLRHQVQELEARIAPPADPEFAVVPVASVPVTEGPKAAVEAPLPAVPSPALSAENPVSPTPTHSPPADAPMPDDAPPFADASGTGTEGDPALRDPIAAMEQAAVAREPDHPDG